MLSDLQLDFICLLFISGVSLGDSGTIFAANRVLGLIGVCHDLENEG